MTKNIIRTALLCGAVAFSTSAFAQVGGAVSGAANSSMSGANAATTGAANGAINPNANTSAPGATINGNTGEKTTASPVTDAQSSTHMRKSKRHTSTPASDTSVNTGVSTPNANASTGTSVTTNPGAASTSTDTSVSTPQPH
jgi:hypothetical protein